MDCRRKRSQGAKPKLTASTVWLLVSFFVHATIATTLALTLGMGQMLRPPPVVWLDLDNRLGFKSAPKKKTKDKTNAKKPKKKAKHKKTRRPKKTKAASKAPEHSSIVKKSARKKKQRPRKKKLASRAHPVPVKGLALDRFVPGDAALMLLLRSDRLRRSPYEQSARELLEVFYDYKTLLWSSGIDPIADIDAILIATPNPYRVTRTFLVARHKLSRSRIIAGIERATTDGKAKIRWKWTALGTQGVIPTPPRLRHDPRVVLVRKGIVMLVDPKLGQALNTSLDKHARRAKNATTAQQTGKSKETKQSKQTKDSPPTALSALAELDKEGGRGKKGPALLLQAVNLARLVRIPAGLPTPYALYVSIPGTDPSPLSGRLIFKNKALARQFHRAAKAQLEKAQRSIWMRLLGLGGLLGRLRLKVNGRHVLVDAKLPASDLRRVLASFRAMIPRVRVPGMKARHGSGTDAGTPNADAASDGHGDDGGNGDAGPRGDAGMTKGDAGPATKDAARSVDDAGATDTALPTDAGGGANRAHDVRSHGADAAVSAENADGAELGSADAGNAGAGSGSGSDGS
jgi:hypothetical protein